MATPDSLYGAYSIDQEVGSWSSVSRPRGVLSSRAPEDRRAMKRRDQDDRLQPDEESVVELQKRWKSMDLSRAVCRATNVS